ncbi:MAG: DUF1559 domain-containing protein [Gemmataceae bacterium]
MSTLLGERTRRPALSAMEVLVLIVIIAILVGLLIPAIQKVRVASARIASANNLKQMSQACQKYDSTHGKLPAAYCENFFVGRKPNLPPLPEGKSGSINLFTLMLPYVGQEELYRLYMTSPNPYYYSDALTLIAAPILPRGKAPIEQVIKTYLAPADPSGSSHQTLMLPWYSQPNLACALTSYAGNFAVFARSGDMMYNPISASMYDLERDYNWSHSCSAGAIQDGASNTLIFSERFGMCPDSVWGADYAVNAWMGNNYYYGVGYMPIIFPRYGRPEFSTNPSNCTSYKMHSLSTGVVQIAMADGSVRSVSRSITDGVWALLLNPQDGQVLPADF